jgi:hypothetical protein
MPTFWTTNWSPIAGITPIWHGPLSAGVDRVALVPAFGPAFLVAADLIVGFAGDEAAGCAAGEDCAHTEVVADSHTNTTTKARTIKAEAPGFLQK